MPLQSSVAEDSWGSVWISANLSIFIIHLWVQGRLSYAGKIDDPNVYLEYYIAIFWKKWAKKNQFLAYSVRKIDDVTTSLQ